MTLCFDLKIHGVGLEGICVDFIMIYLSLPICFEKHLKFLIIEIIAYDIALILIVLIRIIQHFINKVTLLITRLAFLFLLLVDLHILIILLNHGQSFELCIGVQDVPILLS